MFFYLEEGGTLLFCIKQFNLFWPLLTPRYWSVHSESCWFTAVWWPQWSSFVPPAWGMSTTKTFIVQRQYSGKSTFSILSLPRVTLRPILKIWGLVRELPRRQLCYGGLEAWRNREVVNKSLGRSAWISLQEDVALTLCSQCCLFKNGSLCAEDSINFHCFAIYCWHDAIDLTKHFYRIKIYIIVLFTYNCQLSF